jgi:hypothetical protein
VRRRPHRAGYWKDTDACVGGERCGQVGGVGSVEDEDCLPGHGLPVQAGMKFDEVTQAFGAQPGGDDDRDFGAGARGQRILLEPGKVERRGGWGWAAFKMPMSQAGMGR